MPQLIILYLVIAYFVSWWPFQEERWEGFVYPNKLNLTINQSIGEFESLKSCRSASQQMLYQLNAQNSGDYECGLNCEYSSTYGINICEETQK